MKRLVVSLLLVWGFLGCEVKDKEVTSQILPAKSLWVVNSDNTIHVFDRTQMANPPIIITIPSDGKRFAHHLNASADGSKVAIAMPAFDFFQNHDLTHTSKFGGGVSILNASTGKQLLYFEVPTANYNAIFCNNDTEVWTAGVSHTGGIYVYNLKEKRITHEIPVDADPSNLVISDDGGTVAVASQESSFVQFVDVKTKAVRKAKVDMFPTSISLSGVDWIVANKNQNTLNFIDRETQKAYQGIGADGDVGKMVSVSSNQILVANSVKKGLATYSKTNGWARVNFLKLGLSQAEQIHDFLLDNGTEGYLISSESNTLYRFDLVSGLKQNWKVGIQPNGLIVLDK